MVKFRFFQGNFPGAQARAVAEHAVDGQAAGAVALRRAGKPAAGHGGVRRAGDEDVLEAHVGDLTQQYILENKDKDATRTQ